MADTTNSKSVPWKWVAGVLTVIVVGLLSAWGNDVTNRTTLAQVQTAAIAAEMSSLKASYQTILLRLDRIENKIDRLEERKR